MSDSSAATKPISSYYQGVRGISGPKRQMFGSGSNSNAIKLSTTEFEGQCKELKCHIINCGELKHVEVYNTTTEEIVSYVRSAYKDGGRSLHRQ